jgi:hypothetical protein
VEQPLKHTVKAIVLILVFTTLIIGTSIFAQKVLSSTSNELESYIINIENSTASKDWNTAEQNLNQIQNKWASVKGTWAILVDHQEIDNIDVTLTRMQKYVLSRDTSSALAENSALLKFVRHIPKKETLTLENIF